MQWEKIVEHRASFAICLVLLLILNVISIVMVSRVNGRMREYPIEFKTKRPYVVVRVRSAIVQRDKDTGDLKASIGQLETGKIYRENSIITSVECFGDWINIAELSSLPSTIGYVTPNYAVNSNSGFIIQDKDQLEIYKRYVKDLDIQSFHKLTWPFIVILTILDGIFVGMLYIKEKIDNGY